MNSLGFIRLQIQQIHRGGFSVVLKKLFRVVWYSPRIPLYVLAFPVVLLIRLLRPFVTIRLGYLHSSRIGHFAANTEQYLCELDAGINHPSGRFLDFFYFGETVCNKQLSKMWGRLLSIWPAWLLAPIDHINQLLMCLHKN